MQIGYKLATEAFGPAELIRQAVLAEQAGFNFVEMSDHYPDPDGFMDFFARELAEPLRALRPGGGVRDQG
jgi:hypothetical protein